MNEVHFSSKAHDWRTPDEILGPVRRFGGGKIDLDPCADSQNHVGAKSFTFDGLSGCDGLTLNWRNHSRGGLVYANPPYGRELPKWARKFAEEGKKGTELITLTPARTDTKWWHDHMITADAICFWKGRVKFIGPDGPMDACPFPIALCYWGKYVDGFRLQFSKHGWVVNGNR